MNEDLSSSDRQNPGPENASESGFVKLFAVGVMGWLIGVLVVFGISWPVSHPESFSSALMWTVMHAWTAYLFGLVSLVGYGLMKRITIGRAAFAYLLPAVLLAAIGGVCLLVYPDNLLREELFTYLPVVLLFYGFGLIWLWARKGQSATPALARAIVPAVVGGLVILGFVTVPVFASDAFRYRDAFELKVAKVSVRDGAIFVEGSVEIRKPGNYRFSAPRYVWSNTASNEAGEPEVELGQINWASPGAPAVRALGVFPLQIVWRKGVPAGTANELPAYEEFISLEVRNPDEGDKVVYSMNAPLQNP